MASSKGAQQQQKLAEEISKTRNVIRKKHLALRLGKREIDRVINKQAKPIVEPLKQLIHQVKDMKKGKKGDSEEGPISSIKTDFSGSSSSKPLFTAVKKRKKFALQNVMYQTPKRAGGPQKEELSAATARNIFPENDGVEDSDSSYEDAPSKEQPDINNLLARLSPEKKSTPGNRSQYRADFETFLKNQSLGPNSKEYLTNMFLKNNSHDNSYGPYYEFDSLKLGNKPIFFSPQDEMFVGNQGEPIPLTPGILELIFKKTPDSSIISSDDLTVYKNIILQTSLHKSSAGNYQRVKGTRAHKYTNYISKLIKEGSGLRSHRIQEPYLETPMMQVTNNKVDYEYYRDINEIVERLQLIAASQFAGNTSAELNNELYEIIEELEKHGYVLRNKH